MLSNIFPQSGDPTNKTIPVPTGNGIVLVDPAQVGQVAHQQVQDASVDTSHLTASPVHDFVRANPAVKVADVVAKFPALSAGGAQTIINQVRPQTAQLPSAPPINPTSWMGSSTAQVAPYMPGAPLPQIKVNAPQPNVSPVQQSSPNFTPAQAQAPQGGFTPANANFSPSSGGAAVVPPPATTAPSSSTDTALPNWMQNQGLGPNPAPAAAPGALPAWMQDGGINTITPGTPSTPNAPPQSPGAKPGKSTPAWLQFVEKAAPIAIGAAIGGRNPALGGSFFNGWQQGAQAKAVRQEQARQQAKQDQDTKDKATQQTFENKIKQQQADATTTQAAAATTKAGAALSNDQMKQLEAAPDGKAALALYDSMDPTDTKGLRNAFLGGDGNPKQYNPYSKDAAKLDILKQKYDQNTNDKFWANIRPYSGNAEAQKEIAAAYDKDSGTTDFSDALQNGTGKTDQTVNTEALRAVQQQRANTYADVSKAHIKEILASAGLKFEQGQYLKLKGNEVVPLAEAEIKGKNAMASFLTARTGEVVPLADAEIAYKGALGDAATENAVTHRLDAGTKAALAKAGIAVDDARVKEIAEKDPAFGETVKLFNDAQNRKATALNNPLLDPVTKGKIAAAEDVNIKAYQDIIGDRLKSSGGIPAASPITSTVPDIPAIQPKSKQTARSTSVSTFGGSTPSTVQAGRTLSSMFGITDIGGRANAADKGHDGHQANSDHYSGNALDFMTDGDTAKGQKLADYAASHAKELGAKYVIWQQHIFNPSRAAEGWRPMPDRGSPTANHEDHVHISFNGSPAARQAATPSGSKQVAGKTPGGVSFSYTP